LQIDGLVADRLMTRAAGSTPASSHAGFTEAVFISPDDPAAHNTLLEGSEGYTFLCRLFDFMSFPD
jgi:hypothetical protein